MKDRDDKKSLAECYYCAEDNAEWCKLCQKPFCTGCHAQEMASMMEFAEFLTPHQYYDMEFLGVKS